MRSASMDGRRAIGRQPVQPRPQQPLEHGFDVFGFRALAKRLQGQFFGLIHEGVLRVRVHPLFLLIGDAFIFARRCLSTPLKSVSSS